MATFATFLVATPPLMACGPYGIGVHFWLPQQPGPARDSFLGGQLGILDRELDPTYLYVAYRHLAGLENDPDGVPSVSQENLDALATLWPAPASEAPGNPVKIWREARSEVPGLEPVGWFSRERLVSVENGDNTYYSYFLNCLDDGLLTAAETLAARIERFGVESREVRAWVSAQDDVFANCNDGETIPAPLGDGWDPFARADRAYQIAAAHFYAARYADAAELFRAISRDRESPWCALSAYLVARALIRDGRFADAGEQLQAVLADPELATMHEPARRMQAYAALRDDPQSRRRELVERLLAERLEAPLRQDFIDYLWLLEQETAPQEGGSGDDRFGSWLDAMTDLYDASAREVARKHWDQEPELTWLVAALVSAETLDGNGPLVDAAAGVPEESPAYLTVAYHHARLLARQGRAEEARAVLDPILERPDGLSPDDHNRLRHLRAEVTPELAEYLRLVTLVPAGLGWDDGSGVVMPGELGQSRAGGAQTSYFPYYRPGDPILSDAAVELLNHALTLEELLELARGDLLPGPWRRRLALVVWTRAVVTSDDDVALAAAPLVSSLAPELAAEMTAFTAAGAEDRRFEAAWTLLRHPGLAPVLHWNVGRHTPNHEIDNLRDNGWCRDALKGQVPQGQIVRPRALQRGGAMPAWPDFTGALVLARAGSHPEEPRLAEALHRVVRATRIGCPIGGYGETSRAAFQLLHKRFPSSPWAKKTPYWFD